MMRYKEQDMNMTINIDGIGDVTLVKNLMVDTMAQVSNREEAKRFAEKYAEEHNLKLVLSRISIGRWYEKGVGMMFEFTNR